MSFNNFNKLCTTKRFCTTPREGDYFKIGKIKSEGGYIYIIVDNKEVARDNNSFRPCIDTLPYEVENVLFLYDKSGDLRYFVTEDKVYFYSN